MADDPTWGGLARGGLVLAAIWWAWVGYAWLTNVINPEEGVARLVVFLAMAGMLVVALAIPGAFGEDALLFALAYAVVRGAHIVLRLRLTRPEHAALRLPARPQRHPQHRHAEPPAGRRRRRARRARPLAPEVAALAALAATTVVVVTLIAYEAIRFSTAREQIRHHGGSTPPR